MSDLSKQQLILLALLVSFVTSMATGVVTVSLMDQAPQGVVQTINQVIERTIHDAVPQHASVGTVSGNTQDQVASAVDDVSSSIVKIKNKNSNEVTGLGLIVSKEGIILTDKSVATAINDYVAVLPSGNSIPVSIIQSQINGDIVFMAPTVNGSNNASIKFQSITFAPSVSLGQSVYSLSGSSSPILGQGLIVESVDLIQRTSIPVSKVMLGSPLFNVKGEVMGIKTSSLSSNTEGADFYPVEKLRGDIPKFK